MDDTAPQRPPKILLRLLITLLGLAAFLLVILWVGQWTRKRISGLDRYTVALSEIDCPPPPEQNRAEFLAEVQYNGGLPDQLHILDDNLPSRLADAFAHHPEVETVQEVKIVPPRQVRIRLVYRTPALIVSVSESKSGEFFVVDRHGVLLRRSGIAGDLPTYSTPLLAAGPAGSPCSEPNVIAAAKTAAFLQSYRAQFSVSRIEGTTDNLILKGTFTGGGGRSFLWGHAPGDEISGEPNAEKKIQRLLEFAKAKATGHSSSTTIDLRTKIE